MMNRFPRLKLYADEELASPYVASVAVALHEKHLPYDLVSVRLGKHENLAPEYSALSLTQRVPTLVHETFALSESSAIAEYLDHVFTAPDYAPLYPTDVQARARARQVQAWLRSDLGAIRQERDTTIIFFGAEKPPLTPNAQAAARRLLMAADGLISSADHDLFGTWSIADFDLALMLRRLVDNADDVPAKLVGYAERQWARPSVVEWLLRERVQSRG